MALPRPAAALLALSLVACGGSGGAVPNVEKPFTGWLGVPGMTCADGSPTGIGVSPGASDKVLVYLSPGGACWSTAACSPSVPRAFGSGDYTVVQLFASGTIFDRSLAGNPFATWTQVFVPYCTGDVHAGDSVREHGGITWQHHGFRNLQAAVAALGADLPRPTHLVVAGSSAGGFGALAAYDLVRAVWDPAGGTTAALLDDSGPTFVGTAIPSALLARWWDVWGLASTIGTSCPACETDLSAFWPLLHGSHPQDRLAIVSTTQDATMRGFFADAELGIDPQAATTFEANLDTLATRLAGLGPQVASYRVGGDYQTEHALLASSYFLGSPKGPPLLGWLSAMLSLDPTWASSTSP